MTTLHCSLCGRSLEAREEGGKLRGVCPGCGAEIAVSLPAPKPDSSDPVAQPEILDAEPVPEELDPAQVVEVIPESTDPLDFLDDEPIKDQSILTRVGQERRSPLNAALLSFLCCFGLGQFYNGQMIKGVLILLGTVAFHMGIDWLASEARFRHRPWQSYEEMRFLGALAIQMLSAADAFLSAMWLNRHNPYERKRKLPPLPKA